MIVSPRDNLQKFRGMAALTQSITLVKAKTTLPYHEGKELEKDDEHNARSDNRLITQNHFFIFLWAMLANFSDGIPLLKQFLKYLL